MSFSVRTVKRGVGSQIGSCQRFEFQYISSWTRSIKVKCSGWTNEIAISAKHCSAWRGSWYCSRNTFEHKTRQMCILTLVAYIANRIIVMSFWYAWWRYFSNKHGKNSPQDKVPFLPSVCKIQPFKGKLDTCFCIQTN